MCIYLLFHWFSGENYIIRSNDQRCSVFLKSAKFTGKYNCQSLFFNKFAGAATSLLIILTWKSLNIVYRKSIKFFKVLPKENLKSACKRLSLVTEAAAWGVIWKKGVIRRPTTLLKKRLWHRCFPVNFAKFLRTTFSQNTSLRRLLFIRTYIFF